MTFTRITVQAEHMGGVPCIGGLRIPVGTVVGMVADEMSEREIVKKLAARYPYQPALLPVAGLPDGTMHDW